MEPTETTAGAHVRDKLLALPSVADGYKRVLLLGTTGAGKTTVFQLLLRFYDPRAGAVRLDVRQKLAC